MKVSYRWLTELAGVDWPVKTVAERLTMCGTACEDIISTARHLDKVVVGEVLAVEPVPGADKIRKVTVDIGGETWDVICGAPNVAVGQKVPVALAGARLAGGIEIKDARIRGVLSRGMICSEAELGISDDHSGIMVLQSRTIPGTPLADQLDFDDYILDFELTPNRADSMSATGIARDLAALASVRVRYPIPELKPSREKTSDVIKVTIADPEACPRFTARVIRNVKIGPSPWWVQKRLLTAGLRPISNVVDITNLVMLETGNPIHSFDLDRFGSNEVLVRRAGKGEKLVTLDGKEHALSPEVLLITDGKKAMAAAGVMGGLESEVSESTTNILLEVAYFDPKVIRRGRKELGFVSEASTRFEKGVDPNNLPHASARVAGLFQELCGGEVLDGLVDCYPTPIEPRVITFRPERCNTVLRTNYPVERMKQIFTDLEFTVEDGDPMKVTVPTFRHDVSREVDLIEEVARIQGYDSIPDAVENLGPLFTPLHGEDLFADEVRRILTAGGFEEIVGHGLAGSREAALLDPALPQLKIVNPISEDLDIVRNCLALSGLAAVKHNHAHRNMDLRLFEIGRAYFPPDASGQWREEDRLLLLVTGQTPALWREEPRPLDFYDVAGAIGRLASHFRWPGTAFESRSVPYLDEDISFELKVGSVGAGPVGKVSEAVARKFDIKQPLYLAELSISDLIALCRDKAEFEPLPVYPAAPRDLAIVVDVTTRVGDMLDRIAATAGQLADAIDVFDVYVGRQIEQGKKSVGVSISYRSSERSLSSQEVDGLQQNIIDMLKRDFNAEIREK
ncbi:MAG TPA: phenylalanine--tRNA ligase subunit beta [Acidobacteriota bacterium]|nr:phenylalanine--tRNA ligase subunit beta [Acidobacteriota bacterium]